MAVDGKRISDSTFQETDMSDLIACSPCALDDRAVAAEKFCVDCNENICRKCVYDHGRFACMKGHQLIDQVRTKTDKEEINTFSSMRCEKHDGKLIDVFCADHDFVGCSTCIAISHRSCLDVQFIPDISSEDPIEVLYSEVSSELNKLKTSIETYKISKYTFSKHFNEQKEMLVNEIEMLRQKLNSKLDQIQTETLKELDRIFEAKQKLVQGLLDKSNNLQSQISQLQKRLSWSKQLKSRMLFVEIKLSKAAMIEISEEAQLMKNSAEIESIELFKSKEIDNLLEGSYLLAYPTEVPKLNIHSCQEFNVRLKDDSRKCEIKGICVTSAGDIVLADNSNNRVKAFNSDLSPKSSIRTPNSPFDICAIDNSRLAVSLMKNKTIQIMSQNPLQMEEAFKVKDECRGLAFQHEHVFVCCGGSHNEEDAGPGRVDVYDLRGILLESYYADVNIPWYISISSFDSKIFISDWKKQTLITFDQKKRKSTAEPFNGLKKPSGFAAVGNKLCVACYTSGSIMLLKEEHQTQEILTQKDGIYKPRTIAFDINTASLIVSVGDASDVVKVFRFQQ